MGFITSERGFVCGGQDERVVNLNSRSRSPEMKYSSCEYLDTMPHEGCFNEGGWDGYHKGKGSSSRVLTRVLSNFGSA